MRGPRKVPFIIVRNIVYLQQIFSTFSYSQVNGESIRGWQSEDLKEVFEKNTSVTVVVITVEDRSITDLFLMANREHDLRYLWALRKLVKLSICNMDLSEKGLDLSDITTTLYELIVTNCSLKCITQIQGLG